MAKKQGVNYGPNQALIQGAATAYRNYDNVAGMYAGLDKVTKAGTDMMDEAVKGYEEEKKKQEAIEKSWNDSADQVLLNAGSLGDTLYNSTSDEVKELKKLYLQGVNEKDDKKRLAAMRGLQSHSTWIQDHKQMNQDYAAAKKDGKLSSWYSSKAGSEEAHTVDQIMGQKYTKTSRGKDGDVIFHIKDSNGKEKLVPSKEYNNMILPKNYAITANTEKLQTNMNKSRVFSDDIAMQSIKNSLATNERDFVAGMYDDVSGKNLIEMLETSKTLDQEIISGLGQEVYQKFDTDGKDYYEDKNGNKIQGLSPTERAGFIDAVTNPENKLFDLETSKQIMADQIFNGVKNRHTTHWKKVDAKNNPTTTTTGSQIIYGNTNLGDKSFVQQDDILDKAMRNETIYTWGGERFDPDPENPGNYKLVDSISGKEVVGENGEKVNGPIDAILRSKYFGLNERMNSRKLKYPTGIASVESDDLIPELPNNKEKDNTVPLPKARGLTSTGFDTEEGKSKIIGELKKLYKPFGDFKFTSELGNLSITSPDGSDSISVNMDRKFLNTGAQAEIQEFIKKHAKQTEEK